MVFISFISQDLSFSHWHRQLKGIVYAAFVGAFFGFITYATYDMTNLATLRDWPVFITVVDIIWGTVLCGLTASISFIILKAIGI